jgi:hypothetical protein
MARERASITYQVLEAFKNLQRFGESKFKAKQEFKARYNGDKGVDKFMAAFAKSTGVFATTTFKGYLSISIRASEYIKEHFGIKNIKNINSDHIKSYLESISKRSNDTLHTYKSALNKFESALTQKYGQKYDFKINETQFKSAGVKERAGYYSYENKESLIKAIDSNNKTPDKIKLAIAVIEQSGIRLHKSLILNGLRLDSKGELYAVGKGGKIQKFEGFNSLSPETKEKVLSEIDKNGKFQLTTKEYKQTLKHLDKAAEATGQPYEAAHSLKKGFAGDVRTEISEKTGKEYKEIVNSKEYNRALAHNRRVSTYER